MNTQENEVTQPVTPEEKPIKKPRKSFFQRRSSWYLMGILLAFVIIGVGVLLGVSRGVSDRVQVAEVQAAPKIEAQLNSARLDLDEGRYEVALSRLDWILEEMTDYLTEEKLAEVGELYSQTLIQLSAAGSATPVPSPTPTMPAATPTPDLRGEEDLVNTAEQLIAAESWEEAIQTLGSLREKNISFRTVKIDGMLYIALRNRGVQKILVDGSLEPGIYDLTLAERFAPLDSTADGFRTWARLYLTGASYWGVDWAQVVYFFEQIYPALPNLRDGTGMTATERFRIGAIEYGSQLADAGEYCQAMELFERAMSIGPDPEAQPTAQWVADKCWAKQHPPTQAPPEMTPTPTPTTEGGETEVPPPTEEPTS